MAGMFDASRLYESLREVGLLPKHSNIQSGYYDADTNRMTGAAPRTMAHEMTHAAQWNLLMNSAKQIQAKKRSRQEVSPQEEQFLQNMQKVYGESFGRGSQSDAGTRDRVKQAQRVRQDQLESMYKPSSRRGEDAYRTSRRELEAFGVGEFAKGSSGYSEPHSHLNPTMAQEFDVLFSLYNSLPASVKQDFATKRKTEVEEMRAGGYGDRRLNALDFEDIFSDPFAPTIK